MTCSRPARAARPPPAVDAARATAATSPSRWECELLGGAQQQHLGRLGGTPVRGGLHMRLLVELGAQLARPVLLQECIGAVAHDGQQPRGFVPLNPSKKRNARTMASCMTSSAS